jgi:hypothetical protein
VELSSECGADAKLGSGGGQRRHALLLEILDNGCVLAVEGFAVYDHTPSVHIENPIIGNAGARVKIGLYGPIGTRRGIRNFDAE